MPRVGLVVVSHSALIAEGLVELAGQMAPHVSIQAAGGTDDGRIGTSFERVSASILAALPSEEDGGGVVVLCDLGSAILTTDTAIDFLDAAVASRVRVAEAPLVEGAVAAAVSAEAGGSLDEVVAAARTAAGAEVAPEAAPTSEPEESVGYSRTVHLVNKDGLHARPAAEFVKLATTFDAAVTINGKPAKSLLAIMALGLTRGAEVEIATTDESGRAAVDALSELVGSGFGEE